MLLYPEGMIKLNDSASEILQQVDGKRSVAEGYESAPAVRELTRKLGVETPICEAVAAILAGEAQVDQAIAGLLSRPIRSER